MKKSSVKTMELGNLVFGNSRSSYVIDRKAYQKIFLDFLDKAGFDGYGRPSEGSNRKSGPDGVFQNDMFSIRPYYWGDDETIAELPNFVFKPLGVEISWYKYALRDAYCSHDMSVGQFKDMLAKCLESLAA